MYEFLCVLSFFSEVQINHVNMTAFISDVGQFSIGDRNISFSYSNMLNKFELLILDLCVLSTDLI